MLNLKADESSLFKKEFFNTTYFIDFTRLILTRKVQN